MTVDNGVLLKHVMEVSIRWLRLGAKRHSGVPRAVHDRSYTVRYRIPGRPIVIGVTDYMQVVCMCTGVLSENVAVADATLCGAHKFTYRRRGGRGFAVFQRKQG